MNDPSADGTFLYGMTNSGGINLERLIFKYDLRVGINQANTTNQFSIYPNPTSSSFTISALQFTVAQLSIYNTLGEKVYSQIVNGRQLTVNCELPLEVYVVCITSEDESFSKLLAIQ